MENGVASPSRDAGPITLDSVRRADDQAAEGGLGKPIGGPDHQIM